MSILDAYIRRLRRTKREMETSPRRSPLQRLIEAINNRNEILRSLIRVRPRNPPTIVSHVRTYTLGPVTITLRTYELTSVERYLWPL